MRIAILADIHGNLPAFEAALKHAAASHVDQLVIAGDVVNGAPESLECWRLAKSLGCPILRGNHERYVFHFDTEHAHPLWSEEQFAPLHWTLSQFTDDDRREMERLPFRLTLPEFPDLLFVHSSLRSDNDTIAAYTPSAEIAEMFPHLQAETVVRAHNHVGAVRLWNNRVILTTGSVGLPLDGVAAAQYLIIERKHGHWDVHHQVVPYDVDAAVRRFQDTGYLDAGGPMARLFMREVATASFQIVPFFRAYHKWQRASPDSISLANAVDRFLAEY